MVTILYTLILYIVDIDAMKYAFYDDTWIEIPALILTLIFLADLIANFVVIGSTQMWEKRRVLYLEVLLQILYWMSYLLTFWVFTDVSILGRFARIDAIFQLRNLRIVELLAELKEFNMVVQTTHNLTQPIFSKLLFLYIIFYLFAIVGAFLFGGEITE